MLLEAADREHGIAGRRSTTSADVVSGAGSMITSELWEDDYGAPPYAETSPG